MRILLYPHVYAKYITIMNNDNNTILGFDVNLICEYFLSTERQGPGSPEVTLKALSFIDNRKVIYKTQRFKGYFRTSGALSFCT